MFSSNTYICLTAKPGSCILIDPGLDSASIDAVLVERNLKPIAIACTHGHFDHVGTSDFFKKKYACPIVLHGDDIKLAKSSNFLLMACKIEARIKIPSIDVIAKDEFIYEIHGEVVSYIHVPGHTLGSCFVKYRDAIFTGDSLYKNGVGLVDFPGEKPEVLKASLIERWDQIDPKAWIYPGHGGSAPFAWIKENNKRLRQFLGFENGTDESPKVRRLSGEEAKKKFKEDVQ